MTEHRNEHEAPDTAFATRLHWPWAAPHVSYNARQVATAYGCPIGQYDGTGTTIGVIELGGAVDESDFAAAGLSGANVTIVSVDGATVTSDPNGADGEVALDVQVIAAVAPGAKQRVYVAPNTDDGFIAAIEQAAAECDEISISWGSAESAWASDSVRRMSAALAAARAKGVAVFVAAGDSGADDGTSTPSADYPASDPSVIGCGGTRLALASDGSRAAETVWDDNNRSSATGGGVSKLFPGRTVPDVAGNADPDTGYLITVDGQQGVIGGTSAVAPLYAAMTAITRQAYGKPFDLLNALVTNPSVCFDIVSGSNGAFRAGPGRDNVSGLGVVAWDRLLAVLQSGAQVPAPGGATPTPTPSPTPRPTAADIAMAKACHDFLTATGL